MSAQDRRRQAKRAERGQRPAARETTPASAPRIGSAPAIAHGPAPRRVIQPQPGFQSKVSSCKSDVVIAGGSAGCGKTSIALQEAARDNVDVPGMSAVFFRRTTPEIRMDGGLWDESVKYYYDLGAHPTAGILRWQWPRGGRVTMRHLEHESSVNRWQGGQLPLIIFDELTHFCVTPDTDVLTEQGWKRIGEVRIGERVASLTTDRQIVLAPVTATPTFQFDGQLVSVAQRCGISMRVTPNHRIVVDRQDHGRSWGFLRADHLEKASQFIPRTGAWSGVEGKAMRFPLPSGRGCGRNVNAIEQMAMDDYLGFLGWYLAEGSAFLVNERRTSPCVSIRQTRPCAPLADLMARMPWRVRPDGDGGYRIFSRQLFDHVKPLGNRYEKRVPRWVFGLSSRQQQIVLSAFLLGDGHETKGGGNSVGLCNAGLADDVQELAFYCGRVATRGHGVTRGFDVHRVHISSPKRSRTQVFQEDVRRERYAGPVHCLTVDGTGTFLMRHNGRASWTGNSEKQFWFLFSRNRSNVYDRDGKHVRARIIATCNPDADSWVADLIAWWIDQDPQSETYGLPLEERSGVLRYFTRSADGDLVWGDSRAEVVALAPGVRPRDVKSLTFIPGKLDENKLGDPGYRGRLLALSRVERARLLYGNWKIRAVAGECYKESEAVKLREAPPASKVVAVCRRWDLAATEPHEGNKDPDWTVGVKMAKLDDGSYVVLHVRRFRLRAHRVREEICKTAGVDGVGVHIVIPQDPAQAGVDQVVSYAAMLDGYAVHADRETGDKYTRQEPFSAQWQHGRVAVVEGEWNRAFYNILEAYPTKGVHDDDVDAAAGAYHYLQTMRTASMFD